MDSNAEDEENHSDWIQLPDHLLPARAIGVTRLVLSRAGIALGEIRRLSSLASALLLQWYVSCLGIGALRAS